MYRLVLYFLIILVGYSILLGLVGAIPGLGLNLLFSSLFLVGVGWLTNQTFAKIYAAPTNVESVYISALILALIITPPHALSGLPFLAGAAALTMASKFILAIGKKHIFNPVAIAVWLTSVTMGQFASWWIGHPAMLPLVVLGGLLVIRKTRRFGMVCSFLTSAIVVILLTKSDLQLSLLYSPLVFFASVMLTEPQTTPPTNNLRLMYGILVGLLFIPRVHWGSVYLTPELALVLSNVFSYLVSPKQKLTMVLKDKIQVAAGVWDYVFTADQKLSFQPGQYLEWTLGHPHPDARGNRRYFSITSSPSEADSSFGIKFYPSGSSFKTYLANMSPGEKIMASQLAGDLTLPSDINRKCVFIAGGIGITPFRSMIKYLLDIHQLRPIILLYSNKTAAEVAYTDIFTRARQELGIKTVYKIGRINEAMIKSEVPDYQDRLFYLSGPHSLVSAFEVLLNQMGVSRSRIKIDFFPGYT